MIPFILAAVGGYLIGDSMKSQAFSDGGSVTEIQIEKEGKHIKVYYLKGNIGFDGSLKKNKNSGEYEFEPDYFEDKESENYYDENWEEIGEEILDAFYNKMAKGGTIGDAARVKELNKTGVIMKIFKSSDLEQFSDMPRENYYYIKFADGSEGTYGKSELEIFKN